MQGRKETFDGEGPGPIDDWTTKPWAVMVIGASGSGKTTVARGLAPAIDATFLEGDDFHSSAAIAKMRSGTPLTDADREPWLEKIGVAVAEHAAQGRSVVVSCSALRRMYRETLTRYARRPLVFVHLTIDRAILEARMNARHQHFMPTSLLASQLATLERLEQDEIGTEIAETGTAEQAIAAIERWLRRADRTPGIAHEKGRPSRPSTRSRPSSRAIKPRPIGGWGKE